MSFRDWQVGDEVVFLGYLNTHPRLRLLTADRVYKIRAFYVVGPGWADEGTVGILLDGVFNEHDHDGEPGYAPSGFRKVEPRKTSIAILERFLLNPNAPVREDA